MRLTRPQEREQRKWLSNARRTSRRAKPRARARSGASAGRSWRPLIALFALVLLPVLFLQLYFSFHQWTVYLGSWWEADFVGLDLFQEVLTDERFGWAIVRSLVFADRLDRSAASCSASRWPT